jgi:hypothetical protein
MKKILFFTLSAFLILLAACSASKELAPETIKESLLTLSGVSDAEIITEENDPNGNLGKQGSYTGGVYFSSDLIKDVEGSSPTEKGTDGGGCVEIYKNAADAKKRDEYLAEFDGMGAFSSGSHKVFNNMVIRTSSQLTASQQQELESSILKILE